MKACVDCVHHRLALQDGSLGMPYMDYVCARFAPVEFDPVTGPVPYTRLCGEERTTPPWRDRREVRCGPNAGFWKEKS